jgi:FkbM family methyltransferase
MNKLRQRLDDVFAKLIFCMRHAAGPATLLRLMVQTKRLHRFMQQASPGLKVEQPQQYQVLLQGKKINLHLRTLSGDLQIFYEVFWRMVYDLPGVDFDACKVIVDLGGNVGMSALFFALKAPHAALYILEPDADNFTLLSNNLKSLQQPVKPLLAAAASQSGTLYLQQNRYAYNSATVATVTGEPVAAISLNELITTYQLTTIDLLKIDIEGFETELFSQHTEWLQQVRHLVIEIHSAAAFDCCSRVLNAYHFSMQLLSGNAGAYGIYHAFRS